MSLVDSHTSSSMRSTPSQLARGSDKVQADVDRRRGVRERADRDEVRARLGIRADGLQRDAARHLDEHALLVRTRRGVVPTEFGRMLHGHCQALLSELRLLADDLNAWNTGVSGQVIVGSLISASAQLLPQAVTRLRETAPDVVVEVLPEVLDEVVLPHLMCPQPQLWLCLPQVAMAGVAVTAIDETMAAAISVLRSIGFPLCRSLTQMVDAFRRKRRAKRGNAPPAVVNGHSRADRM